MEGDDLAAPATHFLPIGRPDGANGWVSLTVVSTLENTSSHTVRSFSLASCLQTKGIFYNCITLFLLPFLLFKWTKCPFRHSKTLHPWIISFPLFLTSLFVYLFHSIWKPAFMSLILFYSSLLFILTTCSS